MKVNLLDPSPVKRQFYRQRLRVFQTRLLLSAAVIALTFLNPEITNKWSILVGALLYALIHSTHSALGWIGLSFLKLKRVRFARALVDVGLISFVTYYTGGRDSSWFVFYALPIMSVSRYFGVNGSLALAGIASIIYGWIYFTSSQISEPLVTTFVIRIGLLFAVAAAARDLSKVRELDELQPIAFFKEIDSLSRTPAHAYQRIIERGLQLTNSEMGQIFLRTNEPAVAAIGGAEQAEWLNGIDRQLAEKTRQAGHSSSVTISADSLRLLIDKVPQLPKQHPRSALMVPIVIERQVAGIVAVYSNRGFHYTTREQKMLESLSSAVAIVLKHVQLREALTGRLESLHKIATQLSTLNDLDKLFNQVVDLVVLHCKADEAALFVPEVSSSKAEGESESTKPDKPKRILRRVAVAGATKDLTERLRALEVTYPDESQVGAQFFPNGPIRVNFDPKNSPPDEYGKQLTAGSIASQIAAPLFIGEERVGVLRALNHTEKNSDTSPNKQVGFSDDDLDLLREIANQVAAAIHNARTLGRYENLVKYSPDPIIVLDSHGRIAEFNEACEEIWRVNAKEAVGDRVEKYYESLEHAQKIGKALSNAKNERLRNYEASIKNVEDELIPISLSAAILRDKNGKFEGSIGVFKDLRPMQLLLDKVRAAETLAVIGRIARIAGHEIKNQMWVVIGDIDLLTSNTVAPDHRERVYESIRVAALTSVETLEKTLLSANLRPPRKKLAIVQDFFENIHERMAVRARENNIDFVVNFPTEEYVVIADVDQMELVLWNLYHNSIDAILTQRKSDPGFRGQITIATEVSDNRLHLLWHDDGIGIPQDEVDSVFEAFFTKGKPYGTGLGLFLSRNVVEVHGGTITASSEIGAGARFRISLPLADHETGETD